MRPTVGQQNKDKTTTEIMRFIATQWANLTDEDRQKYIDLAAQDKLRYQAAMKSYVAPPETSSAIKPKNPGSAYTFFMRDTRPTVAQNNPGLQTTQIMKSIGEMWSNMTAEDKQKYIDMAAQAKKHYNSAMNKYNANSSSDQRLQNLQKCKKCGLVKKGHACPFPQPKPKKRRRKNKEGVLVDPEPPSVEEEIVEDHMDVLTRTVHFVERQMYRNGGHDMTHALRVWKLATKIARDEGINNDHDLEILQIGALLHDIADWKFSSSTNGGQMAHKFLTTAGCDKHIIARVVHIIENGAFTEDYNAAIGTQDKILACIQDAFHLDAIGAIGIARAFAQGGSREASLYSMQKAGEENTVPNTDVMTKFGEKLFKLKDMMQTNSGRELAVERHEFMKIYIDKFHKEIDNE
jgi:uncharacterized protein